MRYVVLFEDNPDADPDTRTKHMPEHLAFLESRSSSILAAGPLSDDAGQGRGGLWIVEAQSEDEVTHLVRDDPFWPTGLRKDVTIFKWTRVFADGRSILRAP